MLRRFIQLSALAMGLASASVTAMERPNILVIWGDDIGFWNLSTNNMGMMGYQTPNIDRIAQDYRLAKIGLCNGRVACLQSLCFREFELFLNFSSIETVQN